MEGQDPFFFLVRRGARRGEQRGEVFTRRVSILLWSRRGVSGTIGCALYIVSKHILNITSPGPGPATCCAASPREGGCDAITLSAGRDETTEIEIQVVGGSARSALNCRNNPNCHALTTRRSLRVQLVACNEWPPVTLGVVGGPVGFGFGRFLPPPPPRGELHCIIPPPLLPHSLDPGGDNRNAPSKNDVTP